MGLLSKIAVRLALFAGIILLMNVVYERFFLEADLQQHSPIINDIREVPLNTDILYIGESSNTAAARMDEDKRPISALLGDHFPQLNVAHITKPASHAGIYKTLLQKVNPKSEIQTVVVTLNLRSFSIEWQHSELETPLQKSMVLLKEAPALYNRFVLSFKGYPQPTDRERFDAVQDYWATTVLPFKKPTPYNTVIEWSEHIASNPFRHANGTKDSVKTSLAIQYVKTFGFEIDLENNPRIADFNDIIKLAKKRNWNLVFNLLSENTEKAQTLAGKNLVELMEKNRTALVDYFSQKGVRVVDNLATVPDSLFMDPMWPTEHYYEAGRKAVAKKLAAGVARFHPKAYVEVAPEFVSRSHFYNNCEGDTYWWIMESLSRQDSFSGLRSSRTSKDKPYSISFDYPYQKLPLNSRRRVTVSMMVKSKEFSDRVRLAFDLSGESMEHLWRSYSVDSLTTDTQEWQRIEYTYPLGRRAAKADLIGIYLLNESDKIVYVDDIDIRFQ